MSESSTKPRLTVTNIHDSTVSTRKVLPANDGSRLRERVYMPHQGLQLHTPSKRIWRSGLDAQRFTIFYCAHAHS
jgi:hypothetical protein